MVRSAVSFDTRHRQMGTLGMYSLGASAFFAIIYQAQIQSDGQTSIHDKETERGLISTLVFALLFLATHSYIETQDAPKPIRYLKIAFLVVIIVLNGYLVSRLLVESTPAQETRNSHTIATFSAVLGLGAGLLIILKIIVDVFKLRENEKVHVKV